MKVTVLYNEVGDHSSPDALDVLVQRDAVVQSLARLGHDVATLECSLNLAAVKEQLLANRPDAVFNLVESLGGTDRGTPLASMLLDALEIPYTGVTTSAMIATTDKLLAKQRLNRAGLPTPAWFTAERHGEPEFPSTPAMPDGAGVNVACVIVKPIWEHASWGMDDSSVFHAVDREEIDRRIATRFAETGRRHFAERFIAGREFNLSLLTADPRVSQMGSPTGSSASGTSTSGISAARKRPAPQVLPPAEIDFSGLGPDRPHIVGYKAKWDEESMEYHATPRRFDYSSTDGLLLDELARLARACWDLFELSGYARVDFRVDASGRPWILEINSNPCLSPDAGFAAALTRQGLSFDRAVQRILAAACA